MNAAPIAHMSYAEYVAAERTSDTRHEYLNGAVYAMAGGTPEHSALAAAVIGEIRGALRERPCRVYSSDLRIRIPETDLTTYPDVSVVCGKLETDAQDSDAVVNPTVLIEVLSASTEAYDRGTKWAHYRRISSLREYVLIAQDEPRIELYRLNDSGRWELFEARSGERISIAALGISIEVDAIYANPLASVDGAR